MSTRGLIGFVHNGDVHAQYHPHSSYFSFLGQEIVDFCDTVVDWEAFTQAYEKINWQQDIETNLSEDMIGAGILKHILAGNITHLIDEKDFAKDSLFCEYAYLLNLDTQALEIYSSNRQTNHDQSEKHLPLNLLATYPLHEIPSHWKEFLEVRTTEVQRDWKDFYKEQGIEPDL